MRAMSESPRAREAMTRVCVLRSLRAALARAHQLCFDAGVTDGAAGDVSIVVLAASDAVADHIGFSGVISGVSGTFCAS